MTDGIGKITGKWFDTSDINIPDLKVLSTSVCNDMVYWSGYFSCTCYWFVYGQSHTIAILDLKNLEFFTV